MSKEKFKFITPSENAVYWNSYKALTIKSFAVLLFSLLVCSVIQAAGEVDPTFDTGVQKTRDDAGYALAVQSDGKILVGGSFKVVNGVPRNGLARFNADGSLDTTFIVNLQTGSIRSIKLQPDGKILIAGEFTVSVGSISRTNFVRLNSDGSLDTSFIQPTVTSTVFEIQPDGKIVLAVTAGNNANGSSSYAARLNPDGTMDTDFPSSSLLAAPFDMAILPDGTVIIVGGRLNSGGAYIARLNENGSLIARADFSSSGVARAVAVQPDGKFIVGGDFSIVNGLSQGKISRLNPDFSTDVSFNVNGIGFNNPVFDIKLTATGKILVGGEFTTFNGVERKKVARLNSDGTLDQRFNFITDDNRIVWNILPQADGKILVAGGHQTVSSLMRIPLPIMVLRLNEDGSPDNSLFINIGRAGTVKKILAQPDGKILIGGEFEYIKGVLRVNIARLNSDGSADTSFSPDNSYVRAGGEIHDIVRQDDGKILLGRSVSDLSNRNAIIRLNSDGSPDTLFNPGDCGTCSNLRIYKILIQPDGKILIGGGFNTYNHTARLHITRLNANGTLDSTFNPGLAPNNEVHDIKLQPDGKILIAGAFTQINSTGRGRIARLNADGTIDSTFNPPFGANSNVNNIVLQSDGKIVIGGGFTTVNTVNRTRVARLNSDGSLDTGFAPSADWTVEAVTLQSDGKILIGGWFTTVNNAARNRFARLNPDGSLDAAFNNGSGADNNVYDIAVQSDNKILIGGEFTRINNLPAVGLARLFRNTKTPFDFDGDERADVAVFRPANGAWYFQQSTNGLASLQFGLSTDKIVPADYDGDGKADVAAFRSGTWYLQRSQLGFTGVAFGDVNDIPVPADYDGDGKADIAVFRPSNGTWYLLQSSLGFTGAAFGQNGDKPVAADYDGDGKADVAVNRNGTWYIQRSQLGFTGITFGDSNDKSVPADYDGDGKADVAVFRPSNGIWYLQQSTAGFTGIAFGLGTDSPVPADYDGDGKTDIAVFRNGTWYLNRSTQGFTGVAFGASTDKPIPNVFVP